MRKVLAVVPSLVVAGLLGCSASDGDQAGAPSSSTRSGAVSAPPFKPSSSAAAPVPTGPPPADAPVAAVTAWVQAGSPVDAAGFRSATRDDITTDLGADVAFVTPAGKTQCRTGATLAPGAMACLAELADPPAQPAEVYGQWVGNWVDFDGGSAQVGSVHGDPGAFTEGKGRELAYGSSLRFGDYQCRTDPAGLFCVNFARQTALQMSDAGVVAFGCLQEVAPPADAGVRYECL
ncbi:MAG: hypothetical protein ABWY45_23195 [Mycobacterium sp.]